MGFCTDAELEHFFHAVPLVERAMQDADILLLKYWLEVGPQEQQRRLEDRVDDGRKTWKLSPMDIKSYDLWDEYTRARDDMFKATDTPWAPWFVAHSEDKRRVRLNVISHILSQIPYEELPRKSAQLGKRKIGKYTAANYPFKFVPDKY
jgi:polyphosphate kinase 2 (PPK2 family)